MHNRRVRASIIESKLLLQHGFRHGFSTRIGGVSPGPYASLNMAHKIGDLEENVHENLARFCKTMDVALPALHQCEQVHGNSVHIVTPAQLPFESEVVSADAMVAVGVGQSVGVRTADCVPILLADKRTGCVAAVHAGWRGVVANVLAEAIGALLSVSGGSADDLLCVVGPHIRGDAFVVGADVRDTFSKSYSFAVDTSSSKVDLAKIVVRQASACGVPASQMDDVGGCTCSDATRFFSHRREAGKTGRHLSAIAFRANGQ